MIRKRLALWLLVASFAPSLLFAQKNEDCMSCHSDNSLTMTKGRKEISLFVALDKLSKSVHKEMDCVACHKGFDAEAIPHKDPMTSVKCVDCHSDAKETHVFHKTAMAKAKDINSTCVNCHGNHDILSPKNPASKFSKANQSKSCGSCHANERKEFELSIHGMKLASADPNAPSCVDCHTQSVVMKKGSHQDSLVVKLAQDNLCITCHDNLAKDGKLKISRQFLQSYNSSVHRTARLAGSTESANCVDCHGAHFALQASDPRSTMHRNNIASSCNQCHSDVTSVFNESSHGKAVKAGKSEAPTCTGCHGEHEIRGHDDPLSRTSSTHVSVEVCSPCHESMAVTTKFGIASNQIRSFDDSYHGLAVRAGDTRAANCASCHGVHDIKNSRDPSSSIHKDNIAATCGRCHPGANERFAQGSVHVLPTDRESGLLYWVAMVYIVLIVTVVGGMGIHNVLDFWKKAKRKIQIRRGIIKEPHVGHGLYLRMTLSERLQHGTLMVSFILLVITGFWLRFPDAWWIKWVQTTFPWVFDLRSIIHRVAAVALMLVSFFHIYYVLFVPRGKELIRDLLPRLSDATEAFAMAKYNLGLSIEKPELDRFSYIEKAEYWALIWGTIVMAITGFILWFDNYFMGLIGKDWWDVSRTIHYYEAILATLAIIVWHFYFVIFNPDTYPMNVAWIKGTLTEAEMHEEHPKELKRIKMAELKKLEEEEDRREAEESSPDAEIKKQNNSQ